MMLMRTNRYVGEYLVEFDSPTIAFDCGIADETIAA
jgi:hypothetical protein